MERLNTRLAEIWTVKSGSAESVRIAASIGKDFSAASHIPVSLPNGTNDVHPVLVEGYGSQFLYHGVECPLQDGRVGSMVFAVNGGEEAYVVYRRKIETERLNLEAVQGLQRQVAATAEEGFVAGSEVTDDIIKSRIRAEFTLLAEFGPSHSAAVAQRIGKIDRTIDGVVGYKG